MSDEINGINTTGNGMQDTQDIQEAESDTDNGGFEPLPGDYYPPFARQRKISAAALVIIGLIILTMYGLVLFFSVSAADTDKSELNIYERNPYLQTESA